MTVTIAKYLTPLGTDIHQNGIKPDLEADLTEKEIKALTSEDLGTNKDGQYKVAESALVKALTKADAGQTYSPTGANLQSALQTSQ
jgi:carboxyl-terminal processing protease